jgi:acyl-CoA dehydrogenase
LPTGFDEILSQTMHPYTHIVWGALWTGIAADAVNRARAFVRQEARKTPGETPPGAVRLAQVSQLLQEMRHNVYGLAKEYPTCSSPSNPRHRRFRVRSARTI